MTLADLIKMLGQPAASQAPGGTPVPPQMQLSGMFGGPIPPSLLQSGLVRLQNAWDGRGYDLPTPYQGSGGPVMRSRSNLMR